MSLGELLTEYRGDLTVFVRRHAGRLLRFEGVEDLVQGIHVRALEAPYEHRGREPFLKWMYQLARRHLAGRYAHWVALRRKPAALVRLTQADGATASDTGPRTYAERRELLTIAVRALAILPPKDRQMVQWESEDVPLAERADNMGVSYAAADSARRRALERFRKTFDYLLET